MKIKTTKSHRNGRTCTTSIGEIAFDSDGITEIKDDQFKELKHIMPDIVEVIESDKTGGSTVSLETLGDKSEESVREELDELKLTELKNMASKVEGADLDAIKKMKSKSEVIDIIAKGMFPETK